MATTFDIGELYTRENVADAISLPTPLRVGDWLTGYREWNGEVFIFANVGVAGRTGHDYSNRWDGKNLIWYSKGTARLGQPMIDQIVSNAVPIHIFWRAADRARFTYAGMPMALSANGRNPVQVVWSFSGEAQQGEFRELDNKCPSWKRGPPPTIGAVQFKREAGPTDVYLLRLVGPVAAVFDLRADHSVIKIGMSGNVARRVLELNSGFPPGLKLRWEEVRTRGFPTPDEAFLYEGQQLEALRTSGHWIGGEYAVIPNSTLSKLIG